MIELSPNGEQDPTRVVILTGKTQSEDGIPQYDWQIRTQARYETDDVALSHKFLKQIATEFQQRKIGGVIQVIDGSHGEGPENAHFSVKGSFNSPNTNELVLTSLQLNYVMKEDGQDVEGIVKVIVELPHDSVGDSMEIITSSLIEYDRLMHKYYPNMPTTYTTYFGQIVN